MAQLGQGQLKWMTSPAELVAYPLGSGDTKMKPYTAQSQCHHPSESFPTETLTSSLWLNDRNPLCLKICCIVLTEEVYPMWICSKLAERTRCENMTHLSSFHLKQVHSGSFISAWTSACLAEWANLLLLSLFLMLDGIQCTSVSILTDWNDHFFVYRNCIFIQFFIIRTKLSK